MALTGNLVYATVEVRHPDIDGPLVMDFPCTDDDDKIVRRAKVWTMHMYSDARFITSDTTVTILDKSSERTSERTDA